ncbi:MAG: 50S ribosomal protein L9 [Bacteroidota bacterium]
MEIILLEDVEKLGYAGEIVTVKNGYGRNYLIPQKLAVIANKSNRAIVEERMRQEAAKLAKMKGEFEAMAEKLNGIVIKIGAKAGTSGKIFGSVTNVQIAQAVKEQADIDIDRKRIVVTEEVKTLGTFTAEANLHPEVPIRINFEVVSE